MVRNTHTDVAADRKRTAQVKQPEATNKVKGKVDAKVPVAQNGKEKANGLRKSKPKDYAKHGAPQSDENDERFTKVFTDPRFRSVPKFERRIKLDDRFQSMLTDDKFKVKQLVDKRGRPSGLSHSGELDRLYAAESSKNDADGRKANGVLTHAKRIGQDADKEDQESSGDGEPDGLDYARGFGNVESSSEEDETEPEENADADNRTHRSRSAKSGSDQVLFGEDVNGYDEDEADSKLQWTALDADADRSDEITHRLAVVNQDWSRVTAKDLFVLFSSIASSDALVSTSAEQPSVLSVKIYPSQFGLQRMAEEEMMGPKELRDLAANQTAVAARKPKQIDASVLDEDDDPNSITKEQKELAAQKVREYQVNRLKYYYAVIECDSSDIANGIYEYCDGIEFEVSGCRLDLRFIPDWTTFDDVTDQLHDSFDNTMQIDADYEPKHFITQALQQSKVQCSWDEEQIDRKQKLRATRDVENERDLDEICGDGLDDLLASGTSSEEEDDDADEQSAGKQTKSKKSDADDDEEPETLPVRTNKSRLREYQQMLTELNAEGDDADDEFGTKRRGDKFGRNQQPYKQLDKKSISHAFGAVSDASDDDDAGETKGKNSKADKRKGRNNHADESDAADSDVDMELTWQPMQNFDAGDDAENKQSRAERQRKMAQRSLEKVRQKIKQRKRRGEVVDDESSDGEDDLKDGLDYILERVDRKKINGTQENRGNKRPRNADDDQQPVESREFNINAEDPRFNAVFTSSEYNIDVSDPKFKPTKGMHKLIDIKLKTTREERLKSHSGHENSLGRRTKSFMPDNSNNKIAANGVMPGEREDETKMLIQRLKKAASKPSGMLRTK